MATGYVIPEAGTSEWDWDIYLRESGGVAAPESCFFQATNPPANYFDVDMKLEAIDPRCPTNMCLATVVHKAGPRLRLRLDGSDGCNDFWVMVDSQDIHPLGYTELIGGLLLPPLGCLESSERWAKYLKNTMKNCPKAPAEAFVRQTANRPGSNHFKVGMKLEAVDRKNPFLISPATVAGVRSDEIKIDFDGWSGHFDFWCRYDSRDIFPVGWCRKAGHPIQPPPIKIGSSKSSSSDNHSNSSIGSSTAGSIGERGTTGPSSSTIPAKGIGNPKDERGGTGSIANGHHASSASVSNSAADSHPELSAVASVVASVSSRGRRGSPSIGGKAGSVAAKNSAKGASAGVTVAAPERSTDAIGQQTSRHGEPKSFSAVSPGIAKLVVETPGSTANAASNPSGITATSAASTHPVGSSAVGTTTASSSWQPTDNVPLSKLVGGKSASNTALSGMEALIPGMPPGSTNLTSATSIPAVGATRDGFPAEPRRAGDGLLALAATAEAMESISGAGTSGSVGSVSSSDASMSSTKAVVSTKPKSGQLDKKNPLKRSAGSSLEVNPSNPTAPIKVMGRPQRPDIVITCKSETDMKNFHLFINPACKPGPLLDAVKLGQLPLVHGPGSINNIYREAIQSLINCSTNPKRVFSRVTPGDGHLVVTADFDGHTNGRHLPFTANASDTWSHLQKLLTSLGACTNLLSPTVGCSKCGDGGAGASKTKYPKVSSSNGRDRYSGGSDAPSSFMVDLTRNQDRTDANGFDPEAVNWSINEVGEFIARQDDRTIASQADAFRKNEIDGKAMLLLTSEMIIKYMGVKLGPALKIGQLIDRLRGMRKLP